MASSREILLALVRSALWRKPFEVDESMPDWTEILRLAEQQTVMGLVADSLRFLPESMRPSGEMYRKLQMKAVLIAQSHALLNMKLAQTVRFLESNGLNTVLFKGQGVALNYPDPITRQCGDIDLYVGEKSFQKALDLLKADLHRFGLSEAWQILGCIAVEYLGLPPEELPLYTGEYKDKSDMILQIIWSEGNFGKYSKGATPRPAGYIQGKLHSFRRNSSRYGRLIPISPVYMMKAWASYTVTGILNVFNR